MALNSVAKIEEFLRLLHLYLQRKREKERERARKKSKYGAFKVQQLFFEGFIPSTENSLFVVVESPEKQTTRCGAVGVYLQVVKVLRLDLSFSHVCREKEILQGGHDCFSQDWDLC